MPHTRSAKKRLRQNAKRRTANRAVKKVIKIQVKKFLEVIDEGTGDQARQEFNLAAKKLDKAAGKRVLHPNTVARKKSQLARKLNAKLAPKAPAGAPSA
jgi:small subunit ribosomal protein S20